MAVLGPYQVLVYIFKQIFFPFWRKLALPFGIHVIHPCAEVDDLN